jgi:hypothetical protein
LLQKIEEFAKQIGFDKGLLEDDTVGSSCSAHLVVHFAYWSFSSLQEWIVDFGATEHMTKHQHLLSNYRQQHCSGEKVVIGDNLTLPVFGCGDVIIETPSLDMSFMFQELD